jgi:UDP-N-acetylglucosamine diphosphorylase/glucosamine-1-phosphate N-acetyltransferase
MASGVVSLPAGTILAHTRALPLLTTRAEHATSVWTIDSRVAAVRLTTPLSIEALRDGSLTLESVADWSSPSALEGVWLHDVWDIIRHLQSLLGHDIPALAARLDCRALDDDGQHARGPVLTGGHPVWLEGGATVEPFAFLDTTLGPVLLRRGAVVQAFTRVVGPCYIGRDSIVTADRIAGSSIGDTCRVHGELSTSVFVGHANKGHDGFVGHSILGRWVNLGANTVTSNLKNTYGTVAMWTPDGVRDTGLQFLGTLFGDHVKTGIGMRLTTGCVIGAGANVMDAMPPKAVAPFSWGSKAPYARFAREKFLETASRMMARRQVALTTEQREHLAAVYDAACNDARWTTQ